MVPEATTESYCEYVFIHKKLNRPQKGKTKDFLIETGTFAAEVWQSAKIVFPRWARSTFFCHSRLAWEHDFRTLPHLCSENAISKRHWDVRGVAKNKKRIPTLGAERSFFMLSPSAGARFLFFATPLQRECPFFARKNG